MKVLSLLQPWATLVVIGAKKIETRSHNLGYTGEVLIHASLGKYVGTGNDKISCRELCYTSPFNEFVDRGQGYDKLPFGAIIGKVNIRGHLHTIDFAEEVRSTDVDGMRVGEWNAKLTNQEESFGNYVGERWLSLLTDPIQFINPIPMKGQLNVFNCPKEIESLIPQIHTV